MQHSRPLPLFKGPKLPPFDVPHKSKRDITFLEHLGGGLHADVFRAAIDGIVYAVKLFRFVHPNLLVPQNLLDDGWVSVDDVVNQSDPFHCECRACGRLKVGGREDLSARCYGYVLLNQLQEAELARLGFPDWDRGAANRGCAIRGIVKEYIEDSQARTAPHMELDLNSTVYGRDEVLECCVRDLACFDDMVQQWNDSHPNRIFWRRFLPSLAFGQRLRNKSRYFDDLHRQEGARFAAAFYNWDEKDGQAHKPRISTRRAGKKPVAARGGVRKLRASAPSKKKRRKAG